MAKPVVVPIPRNTSRAIPKAPSSQSAAGASNPAAPSAPAKGSTLFLFNRLLFLFSIRFFLIVKFELLENLLMYR